MSRERACEGKVRYSTKKRAAAAAKRVSKMGEEGMNYYKCSYCKEYHIGHMPARLKEQKLQKVAPKEFNKVISDDPIPRT